MRTTPRATKRNAATRKHLCGLRGSIAALLIIVPYYALDERGVAIQVDESLAYAYTIDPALQGRADYLVAVRGRVAANIDRKAPRVCAVTAAPFLLFVGYGAVRAVQDERNARRLPHPVKQGEKGGGHLRNIASGRTFAELRGVEILAH